MRLELQNTIDTTTIKAGARLQAAMFADGNLLVVGEPSFGVLIDAASGDVRAQLKTRSGINSCSVDASGQIAVCGGNATNAYDLGTGAVLGKPGKFKSMLRACAFSPSGDAWMGFGLQLRVHDVATWKASSKIKPPSRDAGAGHAEWLDDDTILASYWDYDLKAKSQTSTLYAISRDGKTRREVVRGETLLTWRLSPERARIFARRKGTGGASLFDTDGNEVKTFEGLPAPSITNDLWFVAEERVISLERRDNDPCLVVWDLAAGTHEVVEIPRDEVGYVSKIAVDDARIALMTSDSVTIGELSA